ncbi:MAG: hypothetical protein V4629_10795 [Pseudomonadota bacterium]
MDWKAQTANNDPQWQEFIQDPAMVEHIFDTAFAAAHTQMSAHRDADHIQDILANIKASITSGKTIAETQNWSPEIVEAVYVLALQSLQSEQLEDAFHLMRLCILLNYFESKYYVGLGSVLQKMKRYDEAVENFTIAFMFDSTNFYAPLNAGLCHLSCQRRAEAASGFTLAQQIINHADQTKRVTLSSVERIRFNQKIASLLTICKPKKINIEDNNAVSAT